MGANSVGLHLYYLESFLFLFVNWINASQRRYKLHCCQGPLRQLPDKGVKNQYMNVNWVVTIPDNSLFLSRCIPAERVSRWESVEWPVPCDLVCSRQLSWPANSHLTPPWRAHRILLPAFSTALKTQDRCILRFKGSAEKLSWCLPSNCIAR